jgi:hypothetical protein
VLFAGIVAGHLGETIDRRTLDFVKDFGLILFVFTMGLQLGPGFFAPLRQQSVKLNSLAVEARASVRDRLRSEGVDEHVGGINRFTSVADALSQHGGESR